MYQRQEVVGVDGARGTVVADVAGAVEADRQASRCGLPHEPLRNPLGLVVAALHPVQKAVNLVVFQVRCIVSSREDAVG